MKTCEMTPKEKTAALEAYCRANESSDICFEWKTSFNRYSGIRRFSLIMTGAQHGITGFPFFGSVMESGFTKHDALSYMFKFIMDSRKRRELETVKSFEEMAMLNAIRGDTP